MVKIYSNAYDLPIPSANMKTEKISVRYKQDWTMNFSFSYQRKNQYEFIILVYIRILFVVLM